MAVNAFELFASLSLDKSDYDKGLDDAGNSASGLGDKIKGGLSAAAQAGTAALAAASAGVAALTKSSLDNYAEYEQLVGGVETLFGTEAQTVEEYANEVGLSMDQAAMSFEQYKERQDTVMQNASNAYKTAGMSANEYMETVTGFAASLNASLGEYAWQSANYADIAVTDMADNANKMGTSMESIKNAYAGFAKQNFTINLMSAA